MSGGTGRKRGGGRSEAGTRNRGAPGVWGAVACAMGRGRQRLRTSPHGLLDLDAKEDPCRNRVSGSAAPAAVRASQAAAPWPWGARGAGEAQLQGPPQAIAMGDRRRGEGGDGGEGDDGGSDAWPARPVVAETSEQLCCGGQLGALRCRWTMRTQWPWALGVGRAPNPAADLDVTAAGGRRGRWPGARGRAGGEDGIGARHWPDWEGARGRK